ncbi:MAG: 16S rRNA (adenine(1518)-N(6)/adenine(1519)-N(6))-dimethyltransferase RsmA [Bacillota bacterium]|nr:16S rRNA (adenine(1518)-N(6)/adenine(1519)-N(6))-dimethyltransferase RsmA [Bacillota bacterium]
MENFNTKDIVKKYGFKFTKSLGQNFLVDESIVKDIVEGAEIGPEDFVIEIGPGVGTLTRELLKKAGRVCSIELDSELIPILKEELRDFDNLELINEDALKVDYRELIGEEKNVKLVANLPYYLTTPIIVKLLTEDYSFKSLTIMIQKEVAERINAAPGGKDYGSLSLLVQYYCNTKIVRKVTPECFIPQPKVDSMVISLEKLPSPRVNVKDKKLLFEIIRDSFNMRRKTLSNAVKNSKLSKENLMKAFEMAGINPQRRGETLSIEEFAELSDKIKELQ